ncbi:MAG: ABC transporter substrate-binding protein, partial [Oscillospiraceae bacterium]|nr:ABC transporter substrate-binding protein [Oscillospiraceae bacterium]
TGFIAQGQIVPVTKYMDTTLAPAIAEIGADYVEACKYSGELYGLPSLHEFGASYGIIFRTDLLEKYNLDVSSIKTFEDLEPMLEVIKQNEPDVIPLTTFNSAYTVAEAVFDSMFDECGDKLGDLRMDDEVGTIITRFESDEYKYWCDVAYDWNQKGYIFEDVATTQETGETLMAAGRVFCWLANGKPGYEEQEELNTGKELTYVQLTPAISTTTSVNALQVGMARNCKNPDKAAEFLNLLYTDDQLMVLLANGIEGKHYNLNEDGLAVMVENSSWVFNSWEMGNNFRTLLWDTDPATKWEDTKVFNETALHSKAFGYTFDMTSLATEIAACQTVLNQYRYAIENGSVSTEAVLDEFINKL